MDIMGLQIKSSNPDYYLYYKRTRMDKECSLYIDHQKVAGLIRGLEEIYQAHRPTERTLGQNHELRLAIYNKFLEKSYERFLVRHPEIKSQDVSIKLEALADIHHLRLQSPNLERAAAVTKAKTGAKKNKGAWGRDLEAHTQLMEWIKQRGQGIYEKKDIDAKFQELVGDPKRKITLKKLEELVKKFALPALIIRTKNNEEHFFGADIEQSVSTLAKVEENSHASMAFFDDEGETVKNSFLPGTCEVKKEQQSFEAMEEEFEQTQRKFDVSKSKPSVMEEESSSEQLALAKDQE